MRLVGYTLQFGAITFAFCIASKILPQFLLIIFAWIANLFLCFCVALWVMEMAQDFFFKAKIDAKNKAVLVTGCDSGFGNAFAKLLDKRGYHVFACCYDKLSEGASYLKDTCSGRLKVVQLDVTKDESVEEAVKLVENNLYKSELWTIVNNAGILKGFHTELSTMKDYEDCIQVNTLGMIRVTKAFLPLLRQSKGRVVNICSISGRFRCPYLGPYTISKAAAVTFTEVLRQEMREFGVRVISIEPEFFKTQMCSVDYLQNSLEPSLSQVDESIKTAFGSEYIEKMIQIYLTVFCNRSDDVKRVHDAIDAAVSLQNPADVYKPCRNIFVTLFFFLGERVALIFIDLFLMITLFIAGLPKPATGTNIISRIFKM